MTANKRVYISGHTSQTETYHFNNILLFGDCVAPCKCALRYSRWVYLELNAKPADYLHFQ
jgi:hypothetical protein